MRVGWIFVAVASVGIGTAVMMSGDEDLHTVERVVDGDTIVVSSPDDDETTRVRLLNVDAPEMKAKNTLQGCYAQEATDFLTQRLPIGTQVHLELDEEESDKYGRTLAGVFDAESGSLINAEIARGGYGVAMLIQPNEKFYPEVLEAQEDARQRSRGMHAPSLDCALPVQVVAATEALREGEPASLIDASDERLEAYHAHLRKVRGEVDRLKSQKGPGEGEDGHAVLRHYREAGESRLDSFDDDSSVLLDDVEAEAERREDEREREEQRLEEERLQEEMKQEEERAEQERRDREAAVAAERSRLQQERQYTAPAPAPAQSPSAGLDTYTGCRDYGNALAPNAVDDQGRPYTKINCSTKLPI